MNKSEPHTFRKLYEKIPANRREIIEARVQGMLARIDGQPSCPTPYPPDNFKYYQLRRAWQEGWSDEDEFKLGKW